MQETPSVLTPDEEEKDMKRECEPFHRLCSEVMT
jgi:hypothetical protein